MKKIRLNLREKLLLFVTLGLILAFTVIGSFRLYQAKLSFTEDMNRSGEERTTLIAESLTNLIVAYDYSNIESLAERIVKLQDVQQIKIMNRAGRVMSSRTSSSYKPNAKGVTFVSSVVFLGDSIGSIELTLSLDRLEQKISETYRNLAFFLIFFAALFGSLIYATVSYLIVKPLSHLSEAANQLALGDFTAVLPADTGDELGKMVSAFSSMRESRRSVENELNSLNASLEAIVEKRIAELRDSETYVHAVLDNVNEGIIVMDSTGLIMSFNPAAEKIFGYTSAEILQKGFKTLISGENAELSGIYKAYSDRTASDPAIGVIREIVGLRKDFSAFPLELKTSQIVIQNKTVFITTARDITDRKDAEQRINYMASHDSLTKLPNRTLLQDRIQQTLAHNHRRGKKAALIFVDLDKFKVINDTLGHDIGDSLLQEAAARLVSCVRSEDTVARQGGDEFIVLLSTISHADDAGSIAQKIIDSINLPFNIQGKELHIGASIGIAAYPEDGDNMETLLKNSDIAMYHAKESGRGNYQFFSAEMNEHATEKQALISSLRHAAERNELFLVYQPVVDMASEIIAGMEVLLRWKHPEFGMISPVKFIPLAEESGLILPIGEWVIRSACEQLKRWQTEGYDVPRLAINLSAKQFRQKTLSHVIERILKETDIEARYIGFEITESMLLQNIEEVVETLLKLSFMGLEISIDDFGTGYSSLSYLKRLPINKLKIDKSFIDDVTTQPDAAAIVKAIIAMAHGLSMKVVTEGVETNEQLEFLRQQGCEQYQGYIFSKPLAASEIISKFKRKAFL